MQEIWKKGFSSRAYSQGHQGAEKLYLSHQVISTKRSNQEISCRQILCFILTGESVLKSSNQVDLTVFCKSPNRVHTSLYVCKSFDKVDLAIQIAPNRADHQKWSLYALTGQLNTAALNFCGYHPHPSFTFYLEGFWVTKSVCTCVMNVFLFMHTVK